MILKFIMVDGELNVILFSNGEEEKFSYSVFINQLIKNKTIEKIEFSEEIEEIDRKKLKEMVKKIEKAIADFN